jgi:hypothetical protein
VEERQTGEVKQPRVRTLLLSWCCEREGLTASSLRVRYGCAHGTLRVDYCSARDACAAGAEAERRAGQAD